MRIEYQQLARFSNGNIASFILVIDTGKTKIVQELSIDEFNEMVVAVKEAKNLVEIIKESVEKDINGIKAI